MKLKPMTVQTKSRVKTTVFWSGLFSALVLFGQALAALFGFELPEETLAQVVIAINALLGLLVVSGVLVDTKDVESFQVMKAKFTN
jgi:phi LC3 family holin